MMDTLNSVIIKSKWCIEDVKSRCFDALSDETCVKILQEMQDVCENESYLDDLIFNLIDSIINNRMEKEDGN